MKLYQVSNKYDRIDKEFDLGQLSDHDKNLLRKVLEFVNQGLTKYQQYEVAEGYTMQSDPNGDPEFVEPLPFFEDALDTMKHF